MQQELPQFYSKRRKNAAAFIYKAAFYTIPRCGISTIMLLTVGLFFLFPACHTFLQLREEKLVPWEMIGSTSNEDIALEELLSIEGVKRVSPVVQVDAEIKFGEYKLNCQVQAVHSSFLNITLLEGVMYNDNSNMPLLILNKTAAESFLSDENTKVAVTTNSNVVMEMSEDATRALICGIFEDNKEIPVVYMSFDFASKTLLRQPRVSLIFALSNKGDMERIVPHLQKRGVSAIYDQNEIIRWELKGKQAWQFFFVSISFLFCATVLMKNCYLQSDKVKREENYVLALMGMTTQQIRWIALLRLLLLYVISLMSVCWISFCAGVFSLLAVIICIISLFIQFAFFHKLSNV